MSTLHKYVLKNKLQKIIKCETGGKYSTADKITQI